MSPRPRPHERHWQEWQRYKVVINEALAGWPLWGLCVFDTQRLPEPLLTSARRTHPQVVTPRGRAGGDTSPAPCVPGRRLHRPAARRRRRAREPAGRWVGTDRIVSAIRDSGTGWDDPFAGYGPAHGEDLSRGGTGLWLARQLCDHVDITSGPDGAQVRLTLTF